MLITQYRNNQESFPSIIKHPDLHQQNTNNRNDQRKVCRRWGQKGRRKRCGLTTALAVVCNVVRAGGNLKDGAIDGSLVVEVDEEEVWWATPIS